MTMLIAEKDHNPCGLLGWFNYERRNWLAGIAVAACLGFAWGNGHTTQNAIADISVKSAAKTAVINRLASKDIPALKSIAGCEHLRADTAVAVAQKDADVDPSNLPNCPSLESAKSLGKVPAQVKKE